MTNNDTFKWDIASDENPVARNNDRLGQSRLL